MAVEGWGGHSGTWPKGEGWAICHVQWFLAALQGFVYMQESTWIRAAALLVAVAQTVAYNTEVWVLFWGAFPSGVQTGFGFFYLRWGFSLTRVQTWIASGLALPVGPWHVVPVQLLAAVPVLPVALSLQPCELQLLPPHPPILRAAGSRQGCAACPGRKRSLNNQTNSSCIAVFAGYSL